MEGWSRMNSHCKGFVTFIDIRIMQDLELEGLYRTAYVGVNSDCRGLVMLGLSVPYGVCGSK